MFILIKRLVIFSILCISLLGITACDSEPPALMKATVQFESEEKRDKHISYMRTHHMHALKHKQDDTMYNGIRTEKHSLKACINCHVPESYNGKVLRHTDPEHFCSTCHNYVAEKLNCFECHVDHPVKTEESVNKASRLSDTDNAEVEKVKKEISVAKLLARKDLSKLSKEELFELAFTYSKNKPKSLKDLKSRGVSSNDNEETNLNDSTYNHEKGGISE